MGDYQDRESVVIDLALIIQGVSVLIIGAAVLGLIKQTNELTRLSTVIEGLERRVENLERSHI